MVVPDLFRRMDDSTKTQQSEDYRYNS